MAFRLVESRSETENKTVRFPVDVINKIEVAISGKNITFSKFVISACRYALENLEEPEKPTSKL